MCAALGGVYGSVYEEANGKRPPFSRMGMVLYGKNWYNTSQVLYSCNVGRGSVWRQRSIMRLKEEK